ncbi:3-keto-5-aminohexanoate cleavage protein [Gudongella sp. DL1XJH-153]|uniref:3-keto-5-aminohexanoate cleavage protein n=1 Tax=Gudongella sp. DL1XJH-153 TaxID=3409804 RepID=UPI003BB6A56B
MEKLIITVASVGSLPTKKETPYVPITPDEIAQDALECYEAGATVLHVHARTPSGDNTHDVALFEEIHEKVKNKVPEMIVQISTGGRAGLGFESRNRGLFANPEMASLTTGSVNFPNMVYENSPILVRELAIMMAERNIKPEIEIFDTSMIKPALELCEEGIIKEPLYFNFIMGLKGAQDAKFSQLSHLLSLIPKDSQWNISGVGRHQIFTSFLGICLGGHVRVGLEDNIYYSKGVLARNSDLVKRVVRLSKEYGREIATASEAREILKL